MPGAPFDTSGKSLYPPLANSKEGQMAKSKPKNGTTLVTFLLDRSGSMGACKPATIEAFNAYLDGLKNGDASDGILFSFLQFDSMSLDKLYVAEPVAKVDNLTTATFVPRGGTPLIDACVKTIRAVEGALTKRDDNPKVVVCFQTDGEENESRQHSWEELNALIKEKTEAGWQFNFMGAGINAYDHAQKMGVGAAQTMSYDHTNLGATRAAFTASSANTMAFASGDSADTSYTMAQRHSAGDAYAAGLDLTPPTTGKKDDKKKTVSQSITDDLTL